MRWLLVFSISVAATASAHDADVIYALVEQHGDVPNQLVERLTMTDATLRLLAPVDVDGDGAVTQSELDAKAGALRVGVWDDMPLTSSEGRCAFVEAAARLRDGFVELTARFDCPNGELRQDFRVLRVLPANYRVVVGSQVDGERAARGIAQGSFSTIPMPRPKVPGTWDNAAFQRGFDDGLTRGFGLSSLALIGALTFSLASWRRGLVATALLLVGAAIATFVEAPWWGGLALAVIAATVSLFKPSAGFAAPLGAGLGLGVGGALAFDVGVVAGSSLLWLPASLAFTAVAVMVARRGGAKRGAWIFVVIALGATIVARLG